MNESNVSVIERLNHVEQQTKQLIEKFEGFSTGLHHIFQRYNEQNLYLQKVTTALIQTVNAIAHFLPEDLRAKLYQNIDAPDGSFSNILQKQVDKNELEEARAAQAAQESAMQQLLREGRIVPVEKVGEKSLVVGRKYDKDGQPFEVNRLQFEYAKVTEEYKDKVFGQPVGAMIEDIDGTKIQITEIYETNPTKFNAPTNNNSSQNTLN